MRAKLHMLGLSFLVLAVAGCGMLFYPKAGDFRKQAQGTTGVETLLNLTTMLEASAKATRGENYTAGLDDLHNQFHALHDSMCGVTEEQAKTPAYAKAVTLEQEMGKIFWRLWKTRNNQALRDVHLDLFSKRNQELREALQAVKG